MCEYLTRISHFAFLVYSRRCFGRSRGDLGFVGYRKVLQLLRSLCTVRRLQDPSHLLSLTSTWGKAYVCPRFPAHSKLFIILHKMYPSCPPCVSRASSSPLALAEPSIKYGLQSSDGGQSVAVHFSDPSSWHSRASKDLPRSSSLIWAKVSKSKTRRGSRRRRSWSRASHRSVAVPAPFFSYYSTAGLTRNFTWL